MTRRRIFKEDAWSSMPPVQKGLILGLLVSAVLALVTWELLWLAAGVFIGPGIGLIVSRRQHSQETARQVHHGSPIRAGQGPARPTGGALQGWKLGWKLMSPVQKTVFIMLIVCVVCALVLPEVPYLIRVAGLGAVGAWLVVRPRRRRRPRPPQPLKDAMKQWPLPHHTPTPRVLTEEERERSLHSAAGFQGVQMVAGKQDRAETLAQMRKTIAGFPPERYEAELEAALPRIHEAQEKARVRRAKFVAEAREMDSLNAVFSIYYFNSRYASHPQEVGLGTISLTEALGDLYSHEQIEETKARCSALIEEGWSCAYYTDDNGRQVQ